MRASRGLATTRGHGVESFAFAASRLRSGRGSGMLSVRFLRLARGKLRERTLMPGADVVVGAAWPRRAQRRASRVTPAMARDATAALTRSPATKPIEASATAARGAPVSADWTRNPQAYTTATQPMIEATK